MSSAGRRRGLAGISNFFEKVCISSHKVLVQFYILMLKAVPIKAAATKLSLPIHEIDTFTGWTVSDLDQNVSHVAATWH